MYKYGITPEYYADLLDIQAGGCAICGALEEDQRDGVLGVDHCHETGAVRGLLCENCNRAIGLLQDDPELLRMAIRYLVGEEE